jgi:hypothetical protein
MLDFYAKSGYRILACANKEIQEVYQDRGDVEHSLTF